MASLICAIGAMAQATRLSSDDLNGVAGSKRIAINLAHDAQAQRQEFISVSGRRALSEFDKTFATELTEFPAECVYEWKNKATNQFSLKSLANEKYMNANGWNGESCYTNDEESALVFFTVKPVKDGSGNTATSLDANLVFDGRDSDTPYWVRFCTPNSTWINANTTGYNGGTGAWTVFYAVDLSGYYKVTLNINKDGNQTNIVKFVKSGATISAPNYDGYVNDYTTPQTKTDNDGQVITINYTKKYTLNIGDTGWATIYLDFNATIPSGVKVYGVKANAEGTKAQLTEVSGVIAANKGYLVNGAATSYTFNESNEAASTVETSLLGSVNDSYVEGAAYVLASRASVVGFYKAELNKDAEGNDGTKCFKNNANKAYLPAGGASARVLTFEFDDNAETGINAVEIEEAAPANAAIYDLSGRRVQSAKSGLYIINGKKVIK